MRKGLVNQTSGEGSKEVIIKCKGKLTEEEKYTALELAGDIEKEREI